MAVQEAGFKVENTLNREGDILPFGYYNPETEGKLVWMCGEDAEGKITGVFSFNDNGKVEKSCTYIESLEKAKYMRDELIKNGWNKLIPPEVKLTIKDEKGKDRPMNRKEKRHMSREVSRLMKKEQAKNS